MVYTSQEYCFSNVQRVCWKFSDLQPGRKW